MALASSSLWISVTLRYNNRPFYLTNLATSTNYFRPILHPSRSTLLTFSSRRRRRDSGTIPITPNTTNKKKLSTKKVEETDDIDVDAFEALFCQLDEDLKNDELNGNDDEDYEISEEELAKLERELAEAFEDDELVAAFGSLAGEDVGSEDEDDDEEEGDVIKNDEDETDIDDDEEGEEDGQEEEETPMKLKNWQLRRLAYALKKGRRKTSIKSLAAELCVDRSIVLKLLRDPPPKLLMLSAALPDKPVSAILEPVENSTEPAPLETEVTDDVNPEVETKVPVHVMQSNWSARKRLKKVQVETLEQVYKKTKRPTNAMVSSIVHVTNLPRKKVVKWFEDKRSDEGVPDNRSPYQRSDDASESSVFTS